MTDELKPCPTCGQRAYTYIRQNGKSVRARDLEDERDRFREALANAAPKVKPLVWEYHPAGAIAGVSAGHAYIIDTRTKGKIYSIKGFYPNREFSSLDEAKAAAQADYERRILSALEGHK